MKTYKDKDKKVYLRLTLISALSAFLLLSSSYLLFAQNQSQPPENEVAFTFGKIEVLKHGVSEWEFLKQGERLSLKDIVRMPPASILRLKFKDVKDVKDVKDEINLPMIIGSREQDVSGLIAYAKGNLASQAQRKLIPVPESSSTADIDALPLGTYSPSPYKEDKTQKAQIEARLDAKQLKLLKLLVQSKIDLVKDSAVKKTHDIPAILNSYPSSNILKALRLFQLFMEDLNAQNEGEKSNFEMQSGFGPEVDSALALCSLLKAASIESDLQINDEGKLFVIFDSGVPNSQFKKLTANRKLTYSHLNQNIWMPLHLNLNLKKGELDFIQAWYNGSEIASK